ncbi:MAG: BMP family ABC transporter substrate-binding protein [Acidaminococcaceae bacterium]|jgi:basic membrane protein A|nr:BMP family ABC transporter substrate-binding protein [Acidaminococcaceae bacterium]
MKMLKSLLLVLVTLLLCTGCGDSFNRTVMLVTQSPAFNDNGYNYGLWSGVQHFALQTKVLTLANPDKKPLLDVVTAAVKQKPGLLFVSADADSNPELEPLVKQHPEIMFVMLDKSAAFDLPNYLPVWIKSNEGAFLAGYLAGRMTTTDKVGFIGGIEATSIDRFKYGFMGGVAYAGRETGRNISVINRTAGTFDDQEKGAELAADMYNSGCDIIFTAAGETGLGAFQEAAQKNKYVIGVDRDQQELAPEHVLCSVLSDYTVLIRAIGDMYLKGERVRPLDNTGLKIGATGLALNQRLVPYNVVREVNKMKAAVNAGLQVPNSEHSYKLFVAALPVQP